MKKIQYFTFLFLVCFGTFTSKAQTAQELKDMIAYVYTQCDEMNSGTWLGKKTKGYVNCRSTGGRVFGQLEDSYYSFFQFEENSSAFFSNGVNSENTQKIFFEGLDMGENFTFSYNAYYGKPSSEIMIRFTFSLEGKLLKLQVHSADKTYDFSKGINSSELAEINAVLKTIPELPLINRKGKASNGVFGIGSYIRIALVQMGAIRPNAKELALITAEHIKLTNRFPNLWK